jgi:hypothetical protein
MNSNASPFVPRTSSTNIASITAALDENPSYDEVMNDARAFRAQIKAEPSDNQKKQLEAIYQVRINQIRSEYGLNDEQFAVLQNL